MSSINDTIMRQVRENLARKKAAADAKAKAAAIAKAKAASIEAARLEAIRKDKEQIVLTNIALENAKVENARLLNLPASFSQLEYEASKKKAESVGTSKTKKVLMGGLIAAIGYYAYNK